MKTLKVESIWSGIVLSLAAVFVTAGAAVAAPPDAGCPTTVLPAGIDFADRDQDWHISVGDVVIGRTITASDLAQDRYAQRLLSGVLGRTVRIEPYRSGRDCFAVFGPTDSEPKGRVIQTLDGGTDVRRVPLLPQTLLDWRQVVATLSGEKLDEVPREIRQLMRIHDHRRERASLTSTRLANALNNEGEWGANLKTLVVNHLVACNRAANIAERIVAKLRERSPNSPRGFAWTLTPGERHPR